MNGTETIVRLPPVVIEFVRDEEANLRLARSSQDWWKLGSDVVTTEIWLPVCDGMEVMLPDIAARRYIIKFMNMKAKRMLAAGFTPRLKTQLESAMIDFAQPINANGGVQ